MTPPTDPSSLPRDVRGKLLHIRAALLQGDIAEAHHHLYAIADPTFESTTPWAQLETGFTAAEMTAALMVEIKEESKVCTTTK